MRATERNRPVEGYPRAKCCALGPWTVKLHPALNRTTLQAIQAPARVLYCMVTRRVSESHGMFKVARYSNRLQREWQRTIVARSSHQVWAMADEHKTRAHSQVGFVCDNGGRRGKPTCSPRACHSLSSSVLASLQQEAPAHNGSGNICRTRDSRNSGHLASGQMQAKTFGFTGLPIQRVPGIGQTSGSRTG